MANNYNPVDVYAIVNAAAKELYGGNTDLQARDLTTFATVGEAMLRTGYEKTLNALTVVMGRTYMAIRPYKHKWDLITINDDLFGTISRKISFFTKLFEPSKAWNTTAAPEQLKDGATVDHYSINKVYPLEMMFCGQKILTKHFTRWEDQLKVAFHSPEELGAFLSGMMVEIQNEIELGIEAENAMLVQNHIGAIYETGTAKQKVNLTKAYNDRYGTTYTSAQLRSEHFRSFLEFMTSTIKQAVDNLTINTDLYHLTPTKTDDAGNPMTLLRHTPRDLQKLFLYKPLLYDAESMVMPEIFSDNYLKLENYEGVMYWQNPNVPASINVKPNILDVTTGQSKDGTQQEIKYVVGLLFDRDALFANYQLNKVLTTPVNAAGDYYNTYHHWSKSHNDDPTENSILFYMEDSAK